MNAPRGTLLLALVLAGCASMDWLAPTATRMAPDALHAAQSLADARVADAAWPATDWWRDFGDPQLDALEAEALAGSPTLRSAQARVDKAQALAAGARSALAPRVDADASITRERLSDHGAAPPPLAGRWVTDSRAALDFGYEFDFWGRNRAALAAAVSDARAAEIDRFAARLVLSVGVARAYIELARAFDQLDIAQTTLAQREAIYRLTRARVDAGLDTRVELKQAEAALPATREDIAALNEAIALARHQLAALAGAGPDRGLAITRPRLAPGRGAWLPTRVPAQLVGRRPDVVAQRWRVQAAAHGIEVAKSRFYPDVNLVAYAGLQSIGLAQLLRAGSGIAGVGPALSLPVFDGGALRSGLAASDADYDSAVERYNQTLIEALHDIADQLASMRAVAAQSEEQKLAVAAAREAYDLALARYRAGVGNYLTVLSAKALVLAQERLAADLRARGRDLDIALVRALGGGWQDAATSAPDRRTSS